MLYDRDKVFEIQFVFAPLYNLRKKKDMMPFSRMPTKHDKHFGDKYS